MRRLLLVGCLALTNCSFITRELLHMTPPMSQIDEDKPHANVQVTVSHPQDFAPHVVDMVRYASLHGGPSGELTAPFGDSGWSTMYRAPIGDGYWSVDTDFFHEETTIVDHGTYETRDVRHVSDARCSAGANYRFEAGRSYRIEFRFEGNARCTMTCVEHVRTDDDDAPPVSCRTAS